MEMEIKIMLDTDTFDELAEMASAHDMPLDRIAAGFVVDGIEGHRMPQNCFEGMRACNDMGDADAALWGQE